MRQKPCAICHTLNSPSDLVSALPSAILVFVEESPDKETKEANMAGTPKNTPAPQDEIIDVSQIVVAPRGRKAVIDSELVERFSTLEDGKAVRLSVKFGAVEKGTDRQRVSGSIRKAWAKAKPGTECSINYGVDGVPTVSRKKVKNILG